VLELVGDFIPEVGEVMGLEGTLDNVFFLIVVTEERGVKGLVLDIAVARWDEVATLRPLSLIFTPTGCHCNELYTYNHRNIKDRVRPDPPRYN
jgi:hypothetical protein